MKKMLVTLGVTIVLLVIVLIVLSLIIPSTPVGKALGGGGITCTCVKCDYTPYCYGTPCPDDSSECVIGGTPSCSGATPCCRVTRSYWTGHGDKCTQNLV